MTMTLTHLTDLQRVRIALSDLTDGTVRLERSATVGFELPVTVRGGVELPISSGAGQLDDYEFFADVQNHYRVTAVDPGGGVLESGSITPSLAGEVWLKSIRYPAQNVPVVVMDYGDVELAPRSAAFPISGRALPTGVGELHGGRDHVLDLNTDNLAGADHLSLMVRTGNVFFIHVPTVAATGCEGNLLLPGSMYVLLGRPSKHRLGGVSEYHRFRLPLTEVTPPGPDVVGTTLTIAGLVELHGSITSVWAAYPTIRDLWDTLGSLDSLVPI